MNNGNSIYNYSYLLQFIVCFFIGRLSFWLNRTKRNQIQSDLDVAELILSTPNPQTRKMFANTLTNKKHKIYCPICWTLRLGDTIT